MENLTKQEIDFIIACMVTIEELTVGYEAVDGVAYGKFGSEYCELASKIQAKLKSAKEDAD